MVDAVELQRMARLVDMNRQRLAELQEQVQRVDAVLFEHEETIASLKAIETTSGGHMSLGAGVMLPINKGTTTLVDLGTGILGERSPQDAITIVQSRIDDLAEVKSQFETEVEVISQRTEELANAFDEAAKSISETKAAEKEPDPESEPAPSTKTRRRRNFGSSLTLDD
jgi:prefoldin alpha subunit